MTPKCGRRKLLFLAGSAAGLAMLVTQWGASGCASGPNDGDPCSQSQVSQRYPYPGSGGCKALVCDGTQFGPYVYAPGDLCSEAGLTCPVPGSIAGSACGPDYSLVCDGTSFFIRANVGPGLPCTQPGLLCGYPGTECGSCKCENRKFVCQEPSCVPDAGNLCPPPALLVAGQPCQPPGETCSTDYACGASSITPGICTCSSGSWTCPCDAGSDAATDGDAESDGDASTGD